MTPQSIIIEQFVFGSRRSLPFSDFLIVDDVVLAVVDHLVRDLNEQPGHSVVGVIVSSDSVNHLDAIHQGGQGILYGLGGAFVKWLDELLEGRQVLDVILGFIQCLRDSQFNAAPLRGGKVNLITRLAELLRWILRSLGEDIVDSPTVFAS